MDLTSCLPSDQLKKDTEKRKISASWTARENQKESCTNRRRRQTRLRFPPSPESWNKDKIRIAPHARKEWSAGWISNLRSRGDAADRANKRSPLRSLRGKSSKRDKQVRGTAIGSKGRTGRRLKLTRKIAGGGGHRIRGCAESTMATRRPSVRQQELKHKSISICKRLDLGLWAFLTWAAQISFPPLKFVLLLNTP